MRAEQILTTTSSKENVMASTTTNTATREDLLFAYACHVVDTYEGGSSWDSVERVRVLRDEFLLLCGGDEVKLMDMTGMDLPEAEAIIEARIA
jgi:hypothetical protein